MASGRWPDKGESRPRECPNKRERSRPQRWSSPQKGSSDKDSLNLIRGLNHKREIKGEVLTQGWSGQRGIPKDKGRFGLTRKGVPY